MSAIIEAKHITKLYSGVAAVSEATFSVKKGEVVGFVGLNGAGKSTTINMLLGFQKPSQGEVFLFGERVMPSNAHISHRRLGFVTGDMSLFGDMTGQQYLGFVARAAGKPVESDAYARLVARFEPQLNKKIQTLSRGNRQKIALVAAFMNEPELVILDEPSSGLDPLMQQHFVELVREEAARGTTIFMSSHYLNEVVDVCSRVLLIKKGQLVRDLKTTELNRTSGKRVNVVTKRKVKPPKAAEYIEEEKRSEGYALTFIYTDKALRLQEWLGTLPNLLDVTITDHTTDAAFDELYKEETGEEVHHV